MLKSVKTEGFYTNHSLHRSSTTRLFNKGVDRKLIKEFVEHTSDAVDAYQVTSEEQRASLSNIIKAEGGSVNIEQNEIQDSDMQISVKQKSEVGSLCCSCNNQTVKVAKTSELGDMIDQIVNVKRRGKATIKIEIEFDN